MSLAGGPPGEATDGPSAWVPVGTAASSNFWTTDGYIEGFQIEAYNLPQLLLTYALICTRFRDPEHSYQHGSCTARDQHALHSDTPPLVLASLQWLPTCESGTTVSNVSL